MESLSGSNSHPTNIQKDTSLTLRKLTVELRDNPTNRWPRKSYIRHDRHRYTVWGCAKVDGVGCSIWGVQESLLKAFTPELGLLSDN